MPAPRDATPERGSRELRWVAACGALCAAVAALALFGWLASVTASSPVPFDEDEAAHANAGLEVWSAVGRHDGPAALAALARQGFYPPAESLIVAASYALLGPTPAASRFPSVVLAVLHLVLVSGAAWAVLRHSGAAGATSDPGLAGAGAVTCAALLITSPIILLHACLCMLEPLALAGFGVLLVALDRAERAQRALGGDGPPSRAWYAVGLALALALLTKYSFGVVELAAVSLALAGRRGAMRRPDVWIARAVRSAGTALVVFATWLAVTDRASARYFFFGHPSYAPVASAQNLLFYPRAWAHEYFVSPAVGLGVLVLAGLGATRRWNRHVAVRVCVFAVIVSWVMLTLSTTTEARHGILMVPAGALLAGLGLAEAIEWLSGKLTGGARWSAVPLVASLAAVAAFAGPWAYGLPAAVRESLEGFPEYDGILSFVSRRVDPAQSILANGLFDQIGDAGLRWRVSRDARGRVSWHEVVLGSYPVDPVLAEMSARRNFAVDALWADPVLARASLSMILATHRFRYVVQIIDRWGEITSPAWSEVLEACRPYRTGRLDVRRWTVFVADLERAPSETAP